MLPQDSFAFLPGNSQTGALIRGIDWHRHAIGPAEHWPGCLKTTLALMFGSRFPMVLWWGPGLVQFYNDPYMPTLGPQKHPSAMGQPGAECWAEAWELVGQQIGAALSSGQATWFEDRCVPIWRNGRLEEAFWTYCFSPVFDEHGCVRGVINIVTETTARVQTHRELTAATAQLQLARQELHSFLMEAPVGLALLTGPHHVYTLLNPVYCEMAFGGRPASDFLDRRVRDAVPELEGHGIFEIFDNVFQTGQSFHGAKMRTTLRQADGAEKNLFVNFTLQARRDERGRIIGIVAVIYEVTDAVNEQKEIELMAESLRAAILARDVFLGVASHELNTPVTSLMLQSQVFSRRMSRQAERDPRAEKFGQDVFRQTKRLERLVSDMLDVSRLAAGKLTIIKKPTDLSALVRDTLDRFLPQLQEVGCSLTGQIHEGIHADIDAIRIEQVLSNLLVNVRKYAPGGPVLATLVWAAPRAQLSVKDSGRGIAPEHQERIFGRYERATSASEASGLGLGLYISAQIVQDHGGEMSLESELGAGSTFTVSLPASCPGL